MNIFLEASQKTFSTGGRDPDDSWSRDSTKTDWDFGELYLSKRRTQGTDDLDITDLVGFKAGDLCYVTLAVWSSGDSFGYDEGECAELFSAHRTREEADKAAVLLRSAPGILDAKKSTLLGNGYQISYAPWGGYFENLDEIRVKGGIIT